VFVAVVPRPGATIDPAELHARLQQVLPRYMVPRYLAVVAELPRTPTNKVRKLDLAASLGNAEVWEAPGRSLPTDR
jgi:crotonobetaine/carnitine-CoA ligase